MWPITDREGKPKIESLTAKEDTSSADHQGISPNPRRENDEQDEGTTSLRPSKSLSSLKLVPKLRGLCIPPGAAISKGSGLCAVGEVSTPLREAETQKQPVLKQVIQEPEHAFNREHDSAATNDRGRSLDHPEEVANKTASSSTDRPSIDTRRKPEAMSGTTEDNVKQDSSSVSHRNQNSGSMPANGLKELCEQVSVPRAVSVQSSAPETVVTRDSEALEDDLSAPEDGKPSAVHNLATDDTLMVGRAVLEQPNLHPSITSCIPIITVQQTTESEELSPPSGALASKSESKLDAVREPILEDPAQESYTTTPVFGGTPAQHDAVAPSITTSAVPTAGIISNLAEVETQTAISPSLNKAEGSLDMDHPGFAKIAVRKARNLAGSKLVLSILLGRQLAEQTKPQLEELARAPMWRSAKTVPVAGPSQVDGIAELEGELEGLSRP